MKKILPAVLLLLLHSLSALAQKTEQYYDWNWKPADPSTARYFTTIEKGDSLWHRQDYFLYERRLQMDGFYKDADTKMAQGLFRYFHANGQLESLGSYNNGKRDGVWLRYYSNGLMRDSATYNNGQVVGLRLGWHSNGVPSDSSFFNADGSGMSIQWFDNGNPSSAGLYADSGKLTGKWKFFHKDGKPSAIEIYDHGKLLSKAYFDETGMPISDTTNHDQEAEFPGGSKAWQKYLYNHLYFPPGYKLGNTDYAVVVVQWAIDESGNVSDIEVIAPLHPDFDKRAISALQKSPKWVPAISHNRFVKAYRRQAFTFVQQ